MSSSVITSNNLSPIIAAFQGVERGQLIIEKEASGAFTARVKTMTFWEKHFPFLRTAASEEKTSLQNLKELIGEKRLTRIFEKEDLSLSQKALNEETLFLTKNVVKRIFIGLGDIRLEDIEEKFEGKIAAIDRTSLHHALIPFEKIEDLFFNQVPAIGPFDIPKSSGKKYQGLRERVQILLSHQPKSNKVKQLITEAELLTSRIADREVPEGTIVQLERGLFICEKIFSKGGAFVSFFRNIQDPTCPPILLCRGTAMRFSATGGYLSGMNDLLFEMGSYGLNAIRDDLLAYLKEKNIQSVDILGKSLGGAFAKYIAALLPGNEVNVQSLTLTCSVGVSETVRKKLEELIIPTTIIRNTSDYIPLIGGKEPYHEKTKLYYIGEKDQAQETLGIPEDTSILLKIWHLFRSLGKAHSHQLTLNKFHFREETESLKKELDREEGLEEFRLVIAKIFNFVTFGYFNKPVKIENDQKPSEDVSGETVNEPTSLLVS